MFFMGMTAERLADMYKITREQSDAFSLRSNMRAVAARERFEEKRSCRSTCPTARSSTLTRDRRRDHDGEAGRPRAFVQARRPGDRGQLPAQLSDGAAGAGSAVLERHKQRALGLKPMAKIRATAVAGVRPEIMGWGPVPSTHKALARAGLKISDIDLFEIDEAFGAQVLHACNTDTAKIDESGYNVNGGAIALGHPSDAGCAAGGQPAARNCAGAARRLALPRCASASARVLPP